MLTRPIGMGASLHGFGHYLFVPLPPILGLHAGLYPRYLLGRG